MSSSSPSSLEKEKSIFLRTQQISWNDVRKRQESRWRLFLIETPLTISEAGGDGNSTTARVSLRPFSEMPLSFPSDSGCVAWESNIYIFGGSDSGDNNSPEVFYLDTRYPNAGWKKGLSMITGRTQPCGAVIDGNIYVMGYHRCSTYGNSSNAASSTPWAEVLDPFMHKWNPLPSHPQLSKGVRSLVVLDGGKKILVYPSQSSSLFSYDVEDKSWDLIDETFGSSFGEFQTPCVVVDDILYCLSTEVRAYDLAKRAWFKKPVKGLKGGDFSSRWYSRDESAAFLVHVGNGRLCLVCSESSISENAIMIVHCTRFRIRKDSDGEEESRLYAIIESLRVYTMDNCNSLTDCLALQVC